jgi:hypothetical protein|tara:strand:+ start:1191 stop:1430 length:240 start_codon:yes stop_codon:yes gene_type:complete
MDEILASIRPVNPSLFGGMPQGESPSQGEQPFDANQYLINKAMEIRQRMKRGDLGALGNVMAALPPPSAQGPQQPPMRA